MHRYSQKTGPRWIRCALLWINGLFPFLWPLRHLLRNFNYPRGIGLFFRDYATYRRKNQDPRFPIRLVDSFPCLFDRFEASGIKPRHYFHQDWWAAKKVFESKVSEHFDFGSRIDGFVAHCSVFCKVQVFDIRPLPPLNANITFIQSDITRLEHVADSSIRSLSSLHVFEHLGLGRYGDPVGSEMLQNAVNEVTRVLAAGGEFYFSVPIGIQRLEFNGQRVFAVRTVLDMYRDLKLIEFSAIDDRDELHIAADPETFDEAEYSCGLFHFRK
jgi:hypothetical protein